MEFRYPRHRWFGHELIACFGVESLTNWKKQQPTASSAIHKPAVVVSCFDPYYHENFVFGDFVDFDTQNRGCYSKQGGYGQFFLALHELSRRQQVFIVLPQPQGTWCHDNSRICYLEIPEFYGIYHDLFRKFYGDSPDVGDDFSHHYQFLNKRNRLGRQALFCELFQRGLLQHGLVSFLGHNDNPSSQRFDPAMWQQHADWIERANFMPKDKVTQIQRILPFSPDPRMRITDCMCGTGGWLPDIALLRDSFIDVVFETHETINGATIFTEKIFRSIYLGKPFIAVGGQGYLTELRKLGFETFDKWIDESWDFPKNLFEKLPIVADQIEIISRQSLKQCRNLRRDMLPVIRHNQKTLEKLSQNLQSRLAKIDEYLLDTVNSYTRGH